MATGTGYSAGRVFLQVVPSYRDFMKALRRDARGQLGKAIADTFEKELGESGYNAASKAGLRAGDGLKDGLNKKLKSDSFSKEIRKSIDKALESLGDTSEDTAARLKTLRKEFDEGGKSANQARRDLDAMGESLHRVGQNDGNVQVATNARRAAEAILGTTEINRRYGEEARRTASEVKRAAKETERANQDSARSERDRRRETDRGVEGNNRVSRSLFSLRAALTGVRGDSNDGANAFRFFNGALLAAVTIGPALIPILAALAGGLALLVPILLGVGAGFGVAILGFSGIGGAVKALSEQQKASSKDSLAYQHAVQTAARGVADAQRGLADAHRSAARGIENALEGQRQAELRLRDAQRDARKAQQDLTEARIEAKRELMDLSNQVAQNQLDERQGVIDLFNAYNQYGAVQADGGSTNLEREQSDIALKQAQLNLKRIREEQVRLAAEKAKADKGGVNGTETVKDAEERLTKALERQSEARRDLKRASRDVDRARADGARQVADAQRALTRAQEDYNYALQGGIEAMDKVREAMDKLSPAGQKFARFLFSLKEGFDSLRRGAQERFLPGVQDGMETILKKGTGFRAWVNGLATDMGMLARKAGNVFTNKTWTDFFAAFAPASRQFTRDFGNTILSVLSGFASIMTVAMPYARQFSKYIADTAASFAEWAASERGQKAIGDFFEMVARVAPKVGAFFDKFLAFAVALAKALGPIGESVLTNLTSVFDKLSKLDPGLLALLAAGFLSILAALQLSSGLVAFISLVGIISGSAFLIGVAAVIALGAAFFFLSKSGGETGAAFDRVMKKLQPFLAVMRDIGGMIMDHVVNIVKNHLLPALRDVGKVFTDEFVPAFVRFYPTIKPIIKLLLWLFEVILIGAINGAKDAIIGVLHILVGVMDFIDDLVHGRWGELWGDFLKILQGSLELIWGLLQILPTRILGFFKSSLGALGGVFVNLFDHIIPGVLRRGMKGIAYLVTHPLEIMKSAFTLFKDHILGKLGELVEKVPGLLGKVGGFFGKKLGNAVIDVTDFVFNKALIGGINKVAGFVGLKGKDGKGILGNIPLPDKFHTGGVVRGPYSPGRDNRMIRVGGGEGILRPEATSAIGGNRLQAINQAAIRGGKGAVQKLLGFAKGGRVWPTKSKHWTTYPGHDGIDLNGKGNGLLDPYFATEDGRVAYTGSGRGYGNKVELKTNGGPTVIYGHSSKVLVSPGEKVKKGQILGRIGYSGHVIPAGPAGSHLHFGLKGESKDQGAAAIKYLLGAVFKGSGFGGLGSKLAGLGSGAISILKDPEAFFKKRIDGGFEKIQGLGGDGKKMLRGAPMKLLGSVVEWVKDKAMSVLGVGKKFFKYTPLGLGLTGVKKGFDLVGKIPGIGNPFGGKGPMLYDNGGYLPPGLSMVMNKTNTPEPILTGKQWAALYESRGQGGDNIDIKAYGADPEKVVNDLFNRLQREKRRVKRSGTLSRKVAP